MKVYGVDLTQVEWDSDAAYSLIDEINAANSDVFANLYKSFCEENGYEYDLDLNDSLESVLDSMQEFCESYRNDTYLWEGISALVTDLINTEKFNGNAVFRNDYDGIYVEPYISCNSTEKAEMPTCEDIAAIIGEYLNPLLLNDAKVEWFEVYDDAD